jgi:hypothetical protein
MQTGVNLKRLVDVRIDELGHAAAANLFGVSVSTIYNWRKDNGTPSSSACQLMLNELGDKSVFTSQERKDDLGKVQLLQPIYRSLNGKTHFTLFANYRQYGAERIGMIPIFNTLIGEARSMLAEQALKTGSEWFLFVDDDMILPFGNPSGLRYFGAKIPDPNSGHYAIDRIMSQPKGYRIISGLYFSKNEKHNGVFASCINSQVEHIRFQRHFETGGDLGVVETAWTGMGFTRVHRSVFEEMQANLKALPEIKPFSEGRHHGYFNQFGPDYSEDASFGLRAAKIGIKSYVDTGLMLGHSGEYIY